MTDLLEHAGTGARLSVPTGWEVFSGGPGEVAHAVGAALEPPREGAEAAAPAAAFRANLVLAVVPTRLDFRQWQVNTDLLLPQVLHDYLLLDLERLPVAGLPGGRRLARHVSPEGVDLTMEQWFVLVDGAGITVTATVDSWRYDAVTDELTAHALSLALPAGVDA